MSFKELYEKYTDLMRIKLLLVDELEDLIHKELLDYDARVYISKYGVTILTWLELTDSLIERLENDYGLALISAKITTRNNIGEDKVLSQSLSYEYTLKYKKD